MHSPTLLCYNGHMFSFFKRLAGSQIKISAQTCDFNGAARKCQGINCAIGEQVDYSVRLSTSQQRNMILRELKRGDKNSQTLSEKTGLTRVVVVRRLGELITQGEVTTRGRGKKLVYIRDVAIPVC